ncbi:MAG: aa3-type cytochrome c oxidase subunit IV [Bradyrhizobiaceae bacterium]|nr:aa3-type cytochrome c oxidase subunit IV [Bradyrhizobiaceae bacterium]
MVDHGEVEYAAATGNDYPQHVHTYESFVRTVTVATLFVVNVVVVLAIWGVAGHWLVALGMFVVALLASLYSVASGSNIPGVVSIVLGLLALLMTTH